MRRVLAAAAATTIAVTANAETLSMNGEGAGMANTTVSQIADGHIVMAVNTTYNGFTVENNPMSDSTGVCNGTMELLAGKLSGGGHCVYSDADGDSWVVNWVPNAMSDKGAVEGNWTMTGGSGKYNGASGGGTFSSLTDQETGKTVNTTTGEVQLK